MIVLDTSVIHALLDAGDQRHRLAREWYAQTDDDLVTTPLVLAEADHLASTRGGLLAVRALRADIRAAPTSWTGGRPRPSKPPTWRTGTRTWASG